MQHSHCLNCEAPLQGSYCYNCGQKASTHRLSLKHFFLHDMVHGIWHLDKGILFTVRKTLVSPGKTAREYIQGKRVGHYNIITLLLLLFAVFLFLQHTIGTHVMLEIVDKNGFTKTYPPSIGIKTIIISFIPIFALVAQLYFRRAKYNYTEHIVAATFALLGILMILVVISMLDWTITNSFFNAYYIEWYLYGLFACFSYYQLFSTQYTFAGFAWRMLSVLATFVFIWLLIAGIIYSAFGLKSFAFIIGDGPAAH